MTFVFFFFYELVWITLRHVVHNSHTPVPISSRRVQSSPVPFLLFSKVTSVVFCFFGVGLLCLLSPACLPLSPRVSFSGWAFSHHSPLSLLFRLALHLSPSLCLSPALLSFFHGITEQLLWNCCSPLAPSFLSPSDPSFAFIYPCCLFTVAWKYVFTFVTEHLYAWNTVHLLKWFVLSQLFVVVEILDIPAKLKETPRPRIHNLSSNVHKCHHSFHSVVGMIGKVMKGKLKY